jgi:hypothetical protein
MCDALAVTDAGVMSSTPAQYGGRQQRQEQDEYQQRQPKPVRAVSYGADDPVTDRCDRCGVVWVRGG